MPKALNLPDFYYAVDRQVVMVEDFQGGLPATWTGVAVTTTAATATDRGGAISLTTTAVDNNVASAIHTAKPVLPVADEPIHFAARVRFAEAATDDANLYVGLSSNAPATQMQDNGAGPAASYSGFGFFKVDGGLNWKVEVSNAGSKVTQELNGQAIASLTRAPKVAGSAAYQLLEVEVIPKNSTKMDVMFKIDGVTVFKVTDFVFTSMVAMGPVFVCKAGGATIETLIVDLCKWAYCR